MRLAALSEALESTDYYALLGVAREADQKTVRNAFHQFALKFHPDQHVDEPLMHAMALRVFKRGNEAYKVLSSELLRKRYDVVRKTGGIRLPARDMQLPSEEVQREAEAPVPANAKPFYDLAQEAFKKGDYDAAKLHIGLAIARARTPAIDALAGQINLGALRAKSLKK